jgi:hypothetical protein
MIRTRIAGLHVSDSKPVAGEEVTIRGYLQQYNAKDKMWIPLRARVKMVVDGVQHGVEWTDPNGFFEFKLYSKYTGKKKVEVLFAGDEIREPCRREITIEFISQEEKRRVERIAKIVLAILILLLILSYVFVVLLRL